MRKRIDIDKVFNELTIKEKALLLSGNHTYTNYGIERLGIESLTFNDGPNGLRKSKEGGNSLDGITKSELTTCFPTGSALCSSWNKDLCYKVGKAIAKECIFYKTDVLLGPSVNIKRNPLCGRNFEYLSEDPYLTGMMASGFINGVSKYHIGTCVKHYACNNNEDFRFCGDSEVDIRALKEIYLKPYELILKYSKPSSFMCSYNKVNGIYSSENSEVLDTFLRKDYGFTGVILTDWGALNDRVNSIKATLDLEMPGCNFYNINELIKESKSDSNVLNKLNESTIRLLNLYNDTIADYEVDDSIFLDNYKLSIEAAKESAILLKNEDNILPLNKNKKYLVIGDMFINPRYQGNGSSLINSYKLSTHIDAFKRRNINFKFFKGYSQIEEDKTEEIEDILNELKNKKYDAILFYGGQTDFKESEGFDRDTLDIPKSQISLIRKIKEINDNIVFISFNGSVINLSFIDDCKAFLMMHLAGEGIGEATTSLLFGECSPSGKTTETYIKDYKDVPFSDEFNKNIVSYYKESIFVGYRYYNSINKEVYYPFGYGLTYTKFKYSKLNVLVNELTKTIDISYEIKNIGHYDASEISEVYVSKINSNIYRPIHELKGFSKDFIKVGESKLIKINIPIDELKIFDINTNSFELEDGEYEILIGKNSRSFLLRDKINLKGKVINLNKNPANPYYFNLKLLNELSNETYAKSFSLTLSKYDAYKYPYDINTPIFAFNRGFGKLLKNLLVSYFNHKTKKALKIKDPLIKQKELKGAFFIARLIPANSLRSLCFSSSGLLKYHTALAILDFCNGHYIRGIKKLFIKEKLVKD